MKSIDASRRLGCWLVVTLALIPGPAWSQTASKGQPPTTAKPQPQTAKPQPQPPAARPAPFSRVFLVMNGSYQPRSEEFRSNLTFVENAEEGTLNTRYSIKPVALFDAGAGFRIARHMAIAASFSRLLVQTPGVLTGDVPHPFFFNVPRHVEGEDGSLQREERRLHLQLRAIATVGRRLELAVFGGPTWFQVEQDLVTDFLYSDFYPYTTAVFRSATLTSSRESKVGFNAGADVSYFFAKHIGIGGSAQYSAATMSMPAETNQAVELRVGGLQVGGGLRIRF